MEWDTDTGHTWNILSAVDDSFAEFHWDFTEILDDVEASIDRHVWAAASRHEAGDGVNVGTDTEASCPFGSWHTLFCIT